MQLVDARRLASDLHVQFTKAAEAANRVVTADTLNAEIVRLSRRNSNVRSLALSKGRKRTVTAQCDDQLLALGDALSKHEFSATR